MPDLAPIVATLAAAATALLALGLLERLGAARGPRSPRAPVPWPERLAPLLPEVPVPPPLRRRWASPRQARRLTHAGLPWQPAALAGLRWLSLWLGLLAAGLVLWRRGGDLLGWTLAGLLLLAGALGPEAWLSLRVERRQRTLDHALPDFLDRLALGLEAGLGFEVALRRTAADFPGLLGEELRRAVRQIDLGHPRARALEEMAERNPSQDLRAFVAAVRQADRLGTSLARTLRVQTALLRAHRRRRAQEASRRLPVLIVFPLVFFFLPALLIVFLAPPILHLFLGR